MYRSRHCFPLRLHMSCATNDHFFDPNRSTKAANRLSSSVVHDWCMTLPPPAALASSLACFFNSTMVRPVASFTGRPFLFTFFVAPPSSSVSFCLFAPFFASVSTSTDSSSFFPPSSFSLLPSELLLLLLFGGGEENLEYSLFPSSSSSSEERFSFWDMTSMR